MDKAVKHIVISVCSNQTPVFSGSSRNWRLVGGNDSGTKRRKGRRKKRRGRRRRRGRIETSLTF